MATVTPGIVWTSGETVTPAKLNAAAAPVVAVADNEITTAKILDGAVTVPKLASALDLSGKTITLPNNSATTAVIADDAVTNDKLALAANDGEIKKALNADNSPPIFACRAWVNFDGTRDTTGATSTANTDRLIRASGNVSSVLRTGVGAYTVTFATAMPDADYAVSALTYNITPAGSSNNRVVGIREGSAKTTTQVVLQITSSAGIGTDQDDVSLMVVR